MDYPDRPVSIKKDGVPIIIYLQFHSTGFMNKGMKGNNPIPSGLLMLVFLAGAGLFLALKILMPQFQGSFAVKAVPALSLTLAAYMTTHLNFSERLGVLVGTFFCAVGDVLLDIDRVRLFVPGLAAFLVAHIGFLTFFGLRRVPANPRRIWIIPVLLFSLIMAVIMLPRLGSLLIPVLAYLVVITLMTALAIFSDVRAMAALGAVIFMLSDAMIAWAKFVSPGQPSTSLSLPVYFAGLFLLGFGILGSQPKRGQ
jgi:uncharacterized membrane protein YhhN